jgi:hypothetical protein
MLLSAIDCFAIRMPYLVASFGKNQMLPPGARTKEFILNWVARNLIDIYNGIDGIDAIYLLRSFGLQ